jgi:DNA-binding NtrC family response regulator
MTYYTILIVDNEKSVANALKRVLWKEGYRILTAHSGREALSKMETFGCQLVLSDYRLPDMKGIDLLNLIKERFPRAIRLIITSQIDLDQLMHEVKKGGISRFITKPWEPDELKGLIREALRDFDHAMNDEGTEHPSGSEHE